MGEQEGTGGCDQRDAGAEVAPAAIGEPAGKRRREGAGRTASANSARPNCDRPKTGLDRRSGVTVQKR